MCLRLCCDPHRLTYIAAIFTACEAVVFGTLNFILIMVAKCIIKPTESELYAGLDKFYSWYYYSVNGSCVDRYGPNFTAPDWVTDDFPLSERNEETMPETNMAYQISYLILHALWFISALLLIYGNARKLWGYYIPWLLISMTFTFMDICIGAFFIIDMLDVLDLNRREVSLHQVEPMVWSFSMYLRAYIFWFANLGHLATVLNAFCKTYHKRSKEKRKETVLQKKHEIELAEARIKAAEEARAEVYNEMQTQIVPAHQDHNDHPVPPAQLQQTELHGRPGVHNYGYEEPGHFEFPDYTEPHCSPTKAPKEVRPFSYLNPGFRPTDPHDVIGMKTNPSPNLPGPNSPPKEPGYFSAVPPVDYNDYKDDNYSAVQLPRVNIHSRESYQSARRNPQTIYYDRQQRSEHNF